MRIVALAGFFKPSLQPEAATESLENNGAFGNISGPDLQQVLPKHIIVAWWDEDITDLARSLAIFAPKGSSVTVISAEKPEVCTTLFPRLRQLLSRVFCLHENQIWCIKSIVGMQNCMISRQARPAHM